MVLIKKRVNDGLVDEYDGLLFGIASDRHGIRVVIVLAGALTAISAAFLRARKGIIRLPISGR